MKHTLNTMLANISDKTFFSVSAAFASVKMALDTYIFSDWAFVVFLIVMVVVDTATGTYLAWKKKTLESKAYGRLFEKLFLYGSLLIMANGLMQFTVSGAATGLFQWVDDVMYCAIMVREAISIIENVGEIKPDLLPKWVLGRLKKFEDSGEFKDLM